MRNVVKIGVACLAVCMMFVACDKNNGNGDDPNNPDNPGGNGSGLSTWTKVTSPLTDSELRCIAFGNGKFVAAGDNSMVAISSDNGKTWTTKKIFVQSEQRIHSIIYANGKFIATGYGRIFHATNPEGEWTVVDLRETLDFRHILVIYHDGTRYVTGGTSGEMAYSTDLVNWTANTTNVFAQEGEAIHGYAFGKGQLVAAGWKGQIAYTTTPDKDWTLVSNNFAGHEQMYAAIFANNTFVVVGSTPTIIYADNPAQTWTKASLNFITSFNAIAYGGGYYVATGSDCTIAYATKPSEWTKAAVGNIFPNYCSINGVAFGNNTFVVVGDAGIADGSTIAYTTVK